MLQQINIKNSPSDVEPLKDHSFIPWCNLHKREKTKHKMQNIQYHSHKKWQKGKESDTERTQSHTWDLLGWGGWGGYTWHFRCCCCEYNPLLRTTWFNVFYRLSDDCHGVALMITGRDPFELCEESACVHVSTPEWVSGRIGTRGDQLYHVRLSKQ